MKYDVLIAFTMADREYLKGSVQDFGEWTPEEQADRLPSLLKREMIVEQTPPVVEAVVKPE